MYYIIYYIYNIRKKLETRVHPTNPRGLIYNIEVIIFYNRFI